MPQAPGVQIKAPKTALRYLITTLRSYPWVVKSCVEIDSCPAQEKSKFVFCRCTGLLYTQSSGCSRLTPPEFIIPRHLTGIITVVQCTCNHGSLIKSVKMEALMAGAANTVGQDDICSSWIKSEFFTEKKICCRNKPCPGTPTHSLAQKFNI